jgi:aspartate/methionine/tyrosine aminotransferase
MPEAGPLPDAPPRISTIEISDADHEYGPVIGLWELRDAVAQLYNQLYRRGMPSQYSAENVAISGGGRQALARAVAALGHVNLGHFLPDYTAYAELLEMFGLVAPIPILLEPEYQYAFSANKLRREIMGRGLGALLVSNPGNPTGRVTGGSELADWVNTVRALDCVLITDEFYSHYLWRPDLVALGGLMSAAQYVEDVDRDPVVILDGLTKNWRYPSWRVAWTLGPKRMIEASSSAGSFLDGGCNRPLQRAAIELLDLDRTRAETRAIHQHFAPKRQRLINGLRDMGFSVELPPDGTFYVWASAQHLPPQFADGMAFFRAALQHQVITVPGEFFDIDPGNRRLGRWSRFGNYVRFSFGPPMGDIDRALERMREMIYASTA